VAVVVDPIQSVKGKVVIDAFRTIQPQTLSTLVPRVLLLRTIKENFSVMGQEPRQSTSNVGHVAKPSIQVGKLYNTIKYR